MLFSLLLAGASAAGFLSAGEQVVQPALPGFVVGYQLERGGNAIVERVPTGENVQRWTRMVTVQRFAGANNRLTPEQLLQNMSKGFQVECRGGQVSNIRSFAVRGYRAAEFRADCPRNSATNQPETFFARSIEGAEAIHVVQVAFRHLPSASEASWAEAHLNRTSLCPAAGPGSNCSAVR